MVDEVTELTQAFRDKFQSKFETSFSVDMIKTELAYESRRRSEVVVSMVS